MTDLVQLRCFVAVAEELHFGRAAARLNMTQPPLSRQLQQLEHGMGVRLVERSSRFVGLTAAGKAFVVEARGILRMLDEAIVTAKRIDTGEGGVLTLGFIPATSYSLLPRLVAFIAAELPHVQLVLKEMVTADQIEALASGRLDAGILRLPVDRRTLESVPISREPFMVAVPAGQRLAGGRALTVKDLDRKPLVMYAPLESHYHHDLVTSIFQSAGIVPNSVQFAREIHTMLALVGAGIGVALVPRIAGNLGFAGVELQEITLQPQVLSELTFVWPKHTTNPALRTFTGGLLQRFVAAQ